jgi:FkbM family methyltransferase
MNAYSNNTMVIRSPALTRAQRLLVALALYARLIPRYGFQIAIKLLMHATTDRVTPSVYGPVFRSRWQDATFRFCIAGMYGFRYSNYLLQLKSSFVFLDIGANIGLYSLIAARNLNCQAVHAFEPNPTIALQIPENAILNQAELRVHAVAISDRSGTLPLYYSDAHTGAGSLAQANGASSHTLVEVRDHTYLDEKLDFTNCSVVVKIDVEGHEPRVIDQLMKSNFWKSIQSIYFEANERRYDVSALQAALRANGFEIVGTFRQGTDLNLLYARDTCTN